MRWRAERRPPPLIGAHRTVTRFAFWPLRVAGKSVTGVVVPGGYWVWLERYCVDERYERDRAGRCRWVEFSRRALGPARQP